MNEYLIKPVAFIRTPFQTQEGTPIQPFAARDVEGQVEVLPEYREALADLEGFERVWLIYWFDRARPYSPTVIPYRDTIPHGLFATRAPTRPNPLGLSLVRLAGIDHPAGLLRVLDVDLLDGTPIIDIKPYVPQYDAFPDSKAGWHEKSTVNRTVADKRFDKE
jgi:tRNA (adenine37-N6)-methyltransferase